MVLIFSKIQRLNHPGAPNGHYGYKEQFEVSEEIAKTYIDAGIAQKVTPPAEPKKEEPIQEVKQPEPEPIKEPEEFPKVEEEIPEPLPPEENYKKTQKIQRRKTRE